MLTSSQFGFKTQLAAAILTLVVTLGSVSTAKAQTLSSARVVMQTGRVSTEQSGELWVVLRGQTIHPGQVLVTGPDGYAQLELSDHSTVEIFSNSRVVFHPNATNWRDLVDIFLGKIRLQIQHLTDGETPYHVSSPTAVISIRGTVLDVEVDASDNTTIQVENGVIGVRHRLLPGREVTVETGQTLRVTAAVPIAASKKGPSPLVTAGRIAHVAGQTLARIGGPGGVKGSGGSSTGAGAPSPSGAGTATVSTTTTSSASTTGGSTSGSLGGPHSTNEPAPAPGNDNGKNAPPGDVIP
jgi:hypothetical protein